MSSEKTGLKQDRYKIIGKPETQTSGEEYLAEIFQRNLEENIDLEELEEALKEYGLDIQGFPALCIKLAIEVIFNTDKDPVETAYPEDT